MRLVGNHQRDDYNTCKYLIIIINFYITFHSFSFEKKANRMFLKASQTIEQSTGLSLGGRRASTHLLGIFFK